MKKLVSGALIAFGLLTTQALAQSTLNHYQPGPRLIDGSQLNLMVDQVNNLTGNGGTPGTLSASTLKVGNGTVSLPAIAFTADTDTGVYRIGTNNIGVAANGAKVLDIATTGLGVTGLISSTTTITAGTALVATTSIAAGTTLTVPGHVITGGTAPALTSCGGGTPAITGSDTAGIVTMGTTATGCVITFAAAYTGTPYCVVSWIATPLASQSYVTSNVAITITQTSTSSNKLQYVCLAPTGG